MRGDVSEENGLEPGAVATGLPDLRVMRLERNNVYRNTTQSLPKGVKTPEAPNNAFSVIRRAISFHPVATAPGSNSTASHFSAARSSPAVTRLHVRRLRTVHSFPASTLPEANRSHQA